MIEIIETETFSLWMERLRDERAYARILARLHRFKQGNPGDVKPLREGISEIRIDVGPGYRVYFTRRGKQLVILLAGGDKRTQEKNIEKAIELARTL